MKKENKKARVIIAIITIGTIIMMGAIYKLVECVDISIQYGWGDYWWVITSFVFMLVIIEFILGIMVGYVFFGLKNR